MYEKQDMEKHSKKVIEGKNNVSDIYTLTPDAAEYKYRKNNDL